MYAFRRSGDSRRISIWAYRPTSVCAYGEITEQAQRRLADRRIDVWLGEQAYRRIEQSKLTGTQPRFPGIRRNPQKSTPRLAEVSANRDQGNPLSLLV